MGIKEKIKDIETEMAKTQKNKATEHHIGRLKAKLAKLRRELLEPPKGSGGKEGEGFAVQKQGNARVSLVGFPSVGKSSLLSKLTKTESKASSFEFTTLTCVPGVIHYNDAKIQLLDLPGIIEGAAQGKGNGKQVLAVAKASDMILIMLDPLKGNEQKKKILKELDAMGIRVNRRKPNISVKRVKTGGIQLTSTAKLTKLDEKTCQAILHEYKIHNAEIICREDCTVDDFIDEVEGNRKYLNAVFVYNKIDTITIEDVDELARRPKSMVISVNMGLNLDYLLEVIWETLDLVRVYTKKVRNLEIGSNGETSKEALLTSPTLLSSPNGGRDAQSGLCANLSIRTSSMSSSTPWFGEEVPSSLLRLAVLVSSLTSYWFRS